MPPARKSSPGDVKKAARPPRRAVKVIAAHSPKAGMADGPRTILAIRRGALKAAVVRVIRPGAVTVTPAPQWLNAARATRAPRRQVIRIALVKMAANIVEIVTSVNLPIVVLVVGRSPFGEIPVIAASPVSWAS